MRVAPLFTVDSMSCTELSEPGLPQLQQFLDANPAYYIAVNVGVLDANAQGALGAPGSR